jgi:hypothetical protein
MKTTKTVLSVLAVLLVFVLLLCLITRLLTPKYATELVEGSMISQYYGETKDHDVIFIGDCEVYSNFSPMEMYRQQGITAYVRGTSQQLIWQSYYILEETLKYETPKVVVYNVNAMRHPEPIKEEFNRLTIDNMRWSSQKVGIIRASMTEEETFASYVFPILRYHSRFQHLTGEDIEYLLRSKDNTFNGYLMKKEVLPVGKLPAKRPLASYDFSENCYDYLEKMTRLCKDKGVELVLIKAPSLYPYWYEEHDAQIRDFAAQWDLAYYDLTKQIDAIGLDFSQDTYDAGLHLNLSGATKLSGYFGQLLVKNHGIPDRRSEPEVARIYDEKLRLYDEAANEKGE